MQRQKAQLQSKIERAQILENDLTPLAVHILELAREHGRIQTSDIEKLTHESRSTIKLRLNELVKRNALSRHGRGPATWYTLAKQ